MAKRNLSVIQEQFCSSYDKRKLCSYDIELISGPTKPLFHQSARFWLFKKGEGTIIINGNSYKVKENSFAAVLPWDTTTITEVIKPLQIIKVIFNLDLLSEFNLNKKMEFNYNKIISSINTSPIIDLEKDEVKKIKSILDTIKDEVGIESMYQIEEEEVFSDVLTSNKIYELLIMFSRFQNKQKLSNRNGENIDVDKRNLIFKYIYSHMSEGVTLSQLAEVFYMSESAVSKYIVSMTGINFNDLVNEMRINKTSDLLMYTDLSLNDVAQIVGFSDASYLVKVFTERTGVAPKQYREIYQVKENLFKEKDRSLGYKLISYIEKNYTENITIADLMNRFNVNASDINTALLYSAEKNFDDLLNLFRINKSCELLLDSDMAIVDVGIAVGYNNAKSFHRNFVKNKKITPSEFRKKYHLQLGSESIPEDE